MISKEIIERKTKVEEQIHLFLSKFINEIDVPIKGIKIDVNFVDVTDSSSIKKEFLINSVNIQLTI